MTKVPSVYMMAEDKYERLPRAGDSEQQLGFETLYLAPSSDHH